MHQRAVAFALHRLHHAQRGERVDEATGALRRRGVVGKPQALLGGDAAVLRVHGAAHQSHLLAQQGLGGRRAAGLDHRACTFIAHRQRLIKPPGHGLQGLFGHLGVDHRALGAAASPGRAHVSSAKEQPQVRRVDGRGFHAHEHFIGRRLRHRDVAQRNFELAGAADQRAQLQGRVGNRGGHGVCFHPGGHRFSEKLQQEVCARPPGESPSQGLCARVRRRGCPPRPPGAKALRESADAPAPRPRPAGCRRTRSSRTTRWPRTPGRPAKLPGSRRSGART